jgi:hypothetical protein
MSNQDFDEMLNKYYKLKEKYEKTIKEVKLNIIKSPGSWKEKRREFSKLKFKCINCKRPVSTKFYTTVDENQDRTIGALCGDTENPCNLNIKINLGIYSNLRDNIQNDKNNINVNKGKIIIEKNDEMFGYTSMENALENYEVIHKNIYDDIELYEYSNQLFSNIVYNDERIIDLNKLEIELNINIATLKQMCKDYENTNNSSLMKDIVELYVNSIKPKNQEIMKKKYSKSFVEFNDYDNNYKLFQIPFEYSTELLELDTSTSGNSVASYVFDENVTKKIKSDKEKKSKKNKDNDKEKKSKKNKDNDKEKQVKNPEKVKEKKKVFIEVKNPKPKEEETKPEETKPEETKQEETKQEETKLEEIKLEEIKPEE